jgi:cholesterol transport system auxiliary component
MSRGRARAVAAMLLLGVAGCAGLAPDKPVRPTLYDFGPGMTAAQGSPQPATLASLVLGDVDASGALDGSAVLYRLGYANPHELRPYAHARWSAPPPQLIRQRLRQQLARERAVLDPGDGAALAREGGAAPRILRLDLEEFSHVFESQVQSWGLLRLRATVMDNTPAGEKLLAQRSFVVRQPAATPDAPGGVRALAAATDTAAEQIGQWLAQLR